MAQKKREDLKRVNFYLPGSLWQFLADEAEEMGLSITAVVIMGLNQYRQQKIAMSEGPRFVEALRIIQQIEATGGLTDQQKGAAVAALGEQPELQAALQSMAANEKK